MYNTNTMGKPFQGEQTRGDKKKERSRGDGVEGVGSSQVSNSILSRSASSALKDGS